jgi:AbrB family looped-hinge helix DNA binding protein
MRVTTTGQVTIPAEIREQFGFLPDTEVEFVVQGDAVSLRRIEPVQPPRGEQVVSQLRGRASSTLTTDDILALTRHG